MHHLVRKTRRVQDLGTRMLKHFLWPVDVEDGPFGAAFALGGQELNGSRIGVIS